MTVTPNFTVTTPSDFEIAMSRVFDAPRHLVFEAMVRPDLIQRWLLGPPGWTMPVCEVDLRVGGAYRYVWHKESTGKDMRMGGVFLEIDPPERTIATEKFDDPWYEGEAITTTLLLEKDGKTTLVQTMKFTDKATRDAVLNTGMEKGVGPSWDRLAEIVANWE